MPTFAYSDLFVLIGDLSKKLNLCFQEPALVELIVLKTLSLDSIADCFFQIALYHFLFRILHQNH